MIVQFVGSNTVQSMYCTESFKSDMCSGDPPFESRLGHEILPTTRTFLSSQQHAKQSLQNSKEYCFPHFLKFAAINQSINQSINQPTNQPTNQPIFNLTSRWVQSSAITTASWTTQTPTAVRCFYALVRSIASLS
jgi:hypothetical protein